MKSAKFNLLILLALLVVSLTPHFGVILRQNFGHLFLSKATLCVYRQPTDASCLEVASRSLSILEETQVANPIDFLWLNIIIGNQEQASTIVGEIPDGQEDPSTIIRFIRLGDLYLAASMWKHSEISYRSVLTLFPDRPESYLKLATLYLSQERYEDALDVLDNGIVSSPKELSRLIFQRGFVYLRSGNSQAALEEFIRCRVWNDAHGGLAYSEPNQLHYFMGEALLRIGQLDQAIPEYQLAIQLDPKLEWPWPTYAAYIGLGDVYIRQKKFAQALAAYEQAFAIALDGDQKILVQGRLQQLIRAQAAPD